MTIEYQISNYKSIVIRAKQCCILLHLCNIVQMVQYGGDGMNERIESIIQERNSQGLSIQQLADMCNLSASTVSRTLSGRTDPTEYTIRLMEDALGITECSIDENRISRMRAFYNMLLTEKDRAIEEKRRWIIFLVFLSISLCVLIIYFLWFDSIHPDIGWIRDNI